GPVTARREFPDPALDRRSARRPRRIRAGSGRAGAALSGVLVSALLFRQAPGILAARRSRPHASVLRPASGETRVGKRRSGAGAISHLFAGVAEDLSGK